MSDHQVISLPPGHVAALDGPRVVADKHFMYALLELDATELRRYVRERNRGDDRVSFTSCLIKLVADCVARHRLAHAIQDGERRLVLYDDVDVTLPVDKPVNERREPLPILIRSANRKSPHDIEREIESFRTHDVRDQGDYVRETHGMSTRAQRLYASLPRFLRLAVIKRMIARPSRAKKYVGTVYVTTVNAAGGLSGWMLPTRSACNLIVAVGSVNRRPWVVHEQVVVRDVVHLTVGFNHAVIDGVPARGFLRDLQRSITGAARLLGPAGLVER